MSALAQASDLERALKHIFTAEPWLFDDVERAMPFRFFHQARRMNAEPMLEEVFAGLKLAAKSQRPVARVMKSLDLAYELALSAKPGTPARKAALNAMRKERVHWQKARSTLVKSDPNGTEALVAWIDRDVEEKIAIIAGRRRSPPTKGASTGKPPKPSGKPTQKQLAKQKAAQQQAAQYLTDLDQTTDEVYQAFTDAAAGSKAELVNSMMRVAAYFEQSDPVWRRIAEKIIAHRSGAGIGDVNQAIQGVLGEALALRTVWVVTRLVSATKRARALAARLGPDWELVLAQGPVLASTRTGGMGELYDASLWIVRKPPPGAAAASSGAAVPLDAAPVFSLQVKSGSVREAAEQIAKDFRRELGDLVRLPAAPAPGGLGFHDYNIKNLNELLSGEGLRPSGHGATEFTTERLIVGPRAPSSRSLGKHLRKGSAVVFIEGLMTKGEMNGVSRAIAKRL